MFAYSNFAPLWTESFSKDSKSGKILKVMDYINDQKLMDYPGGIPTTKNQSGIFFFYDILAFDLTIYVQVPI